MSETQRIKISFWGVRGSVPTPLAQNLGYGGNTPCVEIRLGDGEILILDAGTGIRALGEALARSSERQGFRIRILLSHYHWDHIQGLPFFKPLYAAGNEVSLYAPRVADGMEKTLKRLMEAPYFPVDFETLAASKHLIEVDTNPIRLGETVIHPFPVNHPQGAVGYRIERQQAVIVYATDLEHGDPHLDSVLRDYARQADVLIHDAQFTLEEYENARGWGHTTWLEAARTGRDAQVGRLFLFHHHPSHNDRAVTAMVEEARRHFENSSGAGEGKSLVL